MRVKVSATPKNNKKSKARAGTAQTSKLAQKGTNNRTGVSQPQSTILTSPITPVKQNRRQDSKALELDDLDEDDEEYTHDQDDFEISGNEESESEAFDSPPSKKLRKGKQKAALGPPITTDDRMEDLSEAHRSIAEGFIGDAKTLEEQIRNRKGSAKRPYFTESNFREMILRWTLTLEDMNSIPGIDSERVQQCGKQFIKLIKEWQGFYREAMKKPEDRDIDRQHQDVYEITSGEEESDGDASEIDDENSWEGGPSKYFNSGRVNDFNAKMDQFKNVSQRPVKEPAPAKKTYRKNSNSRGKFFKKRAAGGRKSNGSASGSGTARSRAGTTAGGVSKRKASGGGRQATMGNASRGGASKAGSIMEKFTKGPGMMPT